MYVIVREDGAYVRPPGCATAYTRRLELACTFSTRETAEKHMCQGNERVVPVAEILRAPVGP